MRSHVRLVPLLILATACGDKDEGDDNDLTLIDPAGEGEGEGEGEGPVAACADTNLGSVLGDAVASGSTVGWTNDHAHCGDDRLDWDSGGGDWSGTDHVFSWIAPTSDVYTVDTRGSDYDTTLTVFDADCDETLDCNDDWYGLKSAVVFSATEGDAYAIVVDAYSEGEGGSFMLNISEGDTRDRGDSGWWGHTGGWVHTGGWGHTGGWDSGVIVGMALEGGIPVVIGAGITFMLYAVALGRRREED